MADETRRYAPLDDEDAPMELGDVLEPFDDELPEEGEAFGTRRYQGGSFDLPVESAYPEEPYSVDGEPYSASPYESGEPYAEEYSEYHEELDQEERTRTAIGVFNLVSMLAGVVVVLVLVAMLFSLISWLRTDIVHSITLLQSGIQ